MSKKIRRRGDLSDDGSDYVPGPRVKRPKAAAYSSGGWSSSGNAETNDKDTDSEESSQSRSSSPPRRAGRRERLSGRKKFTIESDDSGDSADGEFETITGSEGSGDSADGEGEMITESEESGDSADGEGESYTEAAWNEIILFHGLGPDVGEFSSASSAAKDDSTPAETGKTTRKPPRAPYQSPPRSPLTDLGDFSPLNPFKGISAADGGSDGRGNVDTQTLARRRLMRSRESSSSLSSTSSGEF